MNTTTSFQTLPHAGNDPSAVQTRLRPQKAYLIAHIEVTDAQRYALYQDIDDDAFSRYGGRFIVRGGMQNALIGNLKTRTIVVEFESMSVAMECYNSLENQSAKAVRLAFAAADAVIVEGYADL